MASRPIDGYINSRYNGKRGGEQQNIPTVAPDARPVVERRGRAAPEAELTLDVTYASGPEAESLARTQYETIWEVLEWLHNNQPPGQRT